MRPQKRSGQEIDDAGAIVEVKRQKKGSELVTASGKAPSVSFD